MDVPCFTYNLKMMVYFMAVLVMILNSAILGNAATTSDRAGGGDCLSNKDCPSDQLCAEFKCVNPCLLNLCDDPTSCKVTNHIPVCWCKEGFSGVLSNKDPNPQTTKPCPSQGKKKFQLYTITKLNWFQALAQCFANNMRLASVESREEFDTIVGMIRKLNLGVNDFWTSGADLGAENTYIWMSDGRPMTYFNWAPSEPSHKSVPGEIEQCIELSWGPGYRMNDASCKTPKLHICEYNE